MKNKIILVGIIVMMLSGCSLIENQIKLNENQLKINAYLIDNANMENINDCTKLNFCEATNCLCDNMASENDYCQEYEDFCVNDICSKITKNFNEVNFMNDYSGDRMFLCSSVYDKTIIINGIDLKNISNEIFTCLSDYRNSQDVPDYYTYHYKYRNEKFFNEYGEVIKC